MPKAKRKEVHTMRRTKRWSRTRFVEECMVISMSILSVIAVIFSIVVIANVLTTIVSSNRESTIDSVVGLTAKENTEEKDNFDDITLVGWCDVSSNVKWEEINCVPMTTSELSVPIEVEDIQINSQPLFQTETITRSKSMGTTREEIYSSIIPSMSWYDDEYDEFYWNEIEPRLDSDEYSDIHNDFFTVWSDIRTQSGLSVDELEDMFDEYYPYLIGHGEDIICAENLYGINAYYITAVCISESGGFESDSTNGFGMTSQTFPNPTESIYKFAELMHSGYISEGLYYPINISEKYCPDGNNDLSNEWATLVVSVENLLVRRINNN